MQMDMMQSAMGHAFGEIRLIVSTNGTSKLVQFRFPRCKSWRIHKKFKKREVNFRIEYVSFRYRDPMTSTDIMVIHPEVEKKMEQIKELSTVTRKQDCPKPSVTTVRQRIDFGFNYGIKVRPFSPVVIFSA